MSMGLYTLGTLVLSVGVLYICHFMHVPQRWVIVLPGAGITGVVTNTRAKDPS